ncbi:MAG: BT_3928 family protein [Bacteroidota bacterium]|nr:BT_3928 family protein [Bacteroidota bacterium]
MRFIYSILRYLVGSIFIFSGLIKINDPVGTQIKLEEYFGVFSSDFTSLFELLVPFALLISIVLCTLEIIIGIALLMNYKMRIVLKLLLSLIVFFTFLTFYSAYFNKVTDCGCFGDAIKLTPWESFYKDIILLVFSISIYFLNKNLKNQVGIFYIKIFDDKVFRNGIIIVSTIICLIISFSAINFLPFIDFRAYKIGNYIPDLMNPSEELKYSYIMEKEGREYEFESYPLDESFTFKKIKLLNPEAQPKITDYSLWNETGDYTNESFLGNKLFIIIHDVNKMGLKGRKLEDFISHLKILVSNINFWIEPIIITSSDSKSFNDFKEKYNIEIKNVYGDATVLKTIIRSNPGFFLLRNGTVTGKWHYNKFPDAKEILRGVNISI